MTETKIIGYYGYPPAELINEVRTSACGYELVDLDLNYNAPNSFLLSDTTCRIIRNIVDNAFHLKEQLAYIICSTGRDKCDGGLFVSHILEREGFKIIRTENPNMRPCEIRISESGLPLKKKILKIMDLVIKKEDTKYEKTEPICGFWGVPPHDLSILELFPDRTHVFGWTRCVEAGTPADINLEMFVPTGLPVVFFSQAFCQKQQFAKYLAEKNRGLYVDVDSYATASVKAKIEAFIELRVLKDGGGK